MDETPHGFAHKVCDRAQVIGVTLDRDMLAAHVAEQEYADILLSLWDVLGPVGLARKKWTCPEKVESEWLAMLPA